MVFEFGHRFGRVGVANKFLGLINRSRISSVGVRLRISFLLAYVEEAVYAIHSWTIRTNLVTDGCVPYQSLRTPFASYIFCTLRQTLIPRDLEEKQVPLQRYQDIDIC
jgi:hypothetical protein